MTAPLLGRNEDLYPSPFDIRREKFIDNPRLDKYLLEFSKEPRQCIGVSRCYELPPSGFTAANQADKAGSFRLNLHMLDCV
jgi:hypothetical protein